MQITVVYNCATKDAANLFDQVCDILRQAGATVVSPSCTDGLPSAEGIRQALHGSDLAVAVGGDGTIVHVAKAAASADCPVLGINGGHLGFLAGLERQELEALPCLLAGEYVLEPRMLLKIEVHKADSDYAFLAMNEAVISRGSFSRLVDVHVSKDGSEILTAHGDGVILATPTGSTAYSLSAGGPVVDPAVPCVLLTPICAHSLDSRSRLFPADTVLTVRTGDTEAFLTVDGEENLSLSGDDYVTIRRADEVARLIRLKETTFYDILKQKIAGRR